MKNKKILFIFLSLITLSFFEGQGSLDYIRPIIIDTNKTQEEITRSFKITTTDGSHSKSPVSFNKTLFNQNQGNFYLGSKEVITDNNLKNCSISVVKVGQQDPFIQGIMPKNTASETENPLYGAQILNLAPFGSTGLIVNAPDSTNANKNIYLVESPGTTAIDTSSDINDAGGSAPTNEIKSITSSSNYIFAAVSATTKLWSDNSEAGINRGIAVIYPDFSQKPATLRVLNANDIDQNVEGNKAAQLSLLAGDGIVAFRKTSAGIYKAIFSPEASDDASVDMIWSSALQRLFVVTTDLARDDDSKEGGVLSIVVGRLEKNTSTNKTSLVFSPIIANPTSSLTPDATTHIIGFYYTANKTDSSKVSTKKVKLMHTSTDKYYLITNSTLVEKTVTLGGGTTTYGTDGVFAFPLKTTDSDPKLVGTLAQTPSINDAKFTVGTNNINSIIEDSYAITDIFVHGDSVYQCLGSQSDPENLGIFQSTAIFNGNGDIIGWTLWQRVMGSIQKVWGGDVDHSTNCFYFLSSPTPSIKDNNSNTVRVTQWNTTELANANISEMGNASYNLSSTLAQIFPQSEGGILQIFDFDDQTDGFNKGEFSMMVVVGYNKIALVQTGEFVNGILKPTTHFEIGTNIIVFNDDSLKNIAPLCCAEVSRMSTKNSGWLFVGGLGGIAVLNKSNNGWDTEKGLSNVTDLSGYSFKQLTAKTGSFANTRKIICQNSKTWLATRDAVYFFDISSNTFVTNSNVNETTMDAKLPIGTKFSDLLVIPGNNNSNRTNSNVDEATITPSNLPTGTRFPLNNNSNRFLIMATTSGLYTFKLGESSAYKIGNNADPAVHLNYISMSKGKPSSTGNLYVLFSNFVDEIGKVYRYYISGENSTQSFVQPIKSNSYTDGFFVDLHYYRGNFATDGSFGYSELAKGIGYNDMFHMYEITTNASDQNYDMTLDININPNTNWYIGTVTKNSTSGSILVPGDWGLIVNE